MGISSLFVGILAVRLVFSLFVVSTADVPDEWWQSTEVGYKFAFGKGELTWEWREAIRSFIYPMPFYLMFSGLQAIGMDTPTLIWAVPRVFTAFIGTGIDYYTNKLAAQNFGPRVAHFATVFSLTNWFTSFIGIRTQSNVAEALVLLIATTHLYDLPKFLFYAGLGVALRVTFILPAIPLFLAAVWYNMFRFPHEKRRSVLNILIWSVVLVGGWLFVIAAIDRYFYGFWICTPYEFLLFNVFKGLSALFGTHPMHWYLSQGLPVMMWTTGIPLFFLPFVPQACLNEISQQINSRAFRASTSDKVTDGAKRASAAAGFLRSRKALFYNVAAFTVVGYSLLPHKEFRFIYPAIPFLIILSALSFASHPWFVKRQRFIIIVIAMTNFIMLGIFGVFFQRGTVEVMQHVRNREGVLSQMDVLTGCHATPGYSYVHQKVDTLRTINCTVLIDPETNTRLPTQHHLYTQYPREFVDWVYDGELTSNKTLGATLQQVEVNGGSWEVPNAIIVFKKYAEDHLQDFLSRHKFSLEKRFYHTFHVLEPDMDTHIDLWVRDE